MAAKRNPARKKPVWGRILHVAAATLTTLVLLVVFYLAVVLGQPTGEDDMPSLETQALLPAAPAEHIADEAELGELISRFPVPVMAFLSGAGPVLQQGASFDTAFENGFARVLELTYALADGGVVQLRTIYPARALSLIERGAYHLNRAGSVSLCGLRAVEMQSQQSIRLHAQSEDAVYVLTAPQMSDDALSTLTKSLQLLTTTGGT